MSFFRPGISVLLQSHMDWIQGKRVGLLAHSASCDEAGVATVQRLQAAGVNLCALFSPEHGFKSRCAAGEKVGHSTHEKTGLLIYSLYGETRKPTPEMFSQLDVIICDLQDLATRCYTYVSTLCYVLETAAETNTTVVITDRPIPLPNTVDGPFLDNQCRSFVGLIPSPVCYAMTPGETALYLNEKLQLGLSLHIAPMQRYVRSTHWPVSMPWTRPSPGIQTWQTAITYPATVCCEALPAFHYGQGSDQIFRCIGAAWLDSANVCDLLNAKKLPGVTFVARQETVDNVAIHYLDIQVVHAEVFRPISTMVHILTCIRDQYSQEHLWGTAGTREGFFDQLMGTAQIRTGIQSGQTAREIIAAWQPDIAAFDVLRTKCLLYHRKLQKGRVDLLENKLL